MPIRNGDPARHLALRPGKRRPVSAEALPQRAVFAFHEPVEAQSSDHVCRAPPDRLRINWQPCQCRLKQMHVRVGAKQPSAVTVLVKSALRMTIIPHQGSDQRESLRSPTAASVDHLMGMGISQQGEGLVIEIEPLVGGRRILAERGNHRTVAAHKMVTQRRKRMEVVSPPGALPAKPPGFAITKHLASRDA